MKKLPNSGGRLAAALLIIGSFVGAANAATLITINLATPNQVTLTATTGLSAVTASGNDGIGVYFENFYGASGNALSNILVGGNITNAENPADNSPSLFRGSSGSDTGLNLWSWSSDTTVTFTSGSLAFTGSATWTLSAAEYSDMVNGNKSGDIYFPADTADDIAGGAVAIGTYEVIPEPSSTALIALGLLVLGHRRSRR